MGHFYQPLVDSLQHITEWKDSSAASKAEQLRVAVCRGSFVLSLAVLNKVLALSLPLSKSLQDSCLEANEQIYQSKRKRRILPIDGVENFFGERYSVVPRHIASIPQ
ncbi:hypothetical protein T09_13578 [Trichinella sp. T9]|nr:hypothetical protein T09_4430 [Trichinella sp. T9]KRX39277.1 hypothetical protein T09_13578 [Trichinella sp. T9]